MSTKFGERRDDISISSCGGEWKRKKWIQKKRPGKAYSYVQITYICSWKFGWQTRLIDIASSADRSDLFERPNARAKVKSGALWNLIIIVADVSKSYSCTHSLQNVKDDSHSVIVHWFQRLVNQVRQYSFEKQRCMNWRAPKRNWSFHVFLRIIKNELISPACLVRSAICRV